MSVRTGEDQSKGIMKGAGSERQRPITLSIITTIIVGIHQTG